jgi:hypothetical protein
MDAPLNTIEQDIDKKALSVNLDTSIYGSIAEIGAGQEVARRFFAVGGAAGTIAKSMSAYDMKFSDEIYGPAPRYVSRERLQSMLNHEYGLLIERLSAEKGAQSRFFAFADTVSARNFQGTNECHGWMGIRFQREPFGEPLDIELHVRMLDRANILQQQALGILGVNIIYGAFAFTDSLEQFVLSLLDGLEPGRIEIEGIHCRGADLEKVDIRLLNLRLIQHKLSSAVLFGVDEPVIHISDVLRKRPLVVQRGSFRPVTHVNVDMLESVRRQFISEHGLPEDQPLELFELTIKNLVSHELDDDETVLGIISMLTALGRPVLLTDYAEFYRLSTFIRQFTREPIAIVLGINNLYNLFNESYYEHLDGGILEAFGRLFHQKMCVYAYPTSREIFLRFIESRGAEVASLTIPDEPIVTSENVHVAHDLRLLFRYLRERNFLRPVTDFTVEHLKNHSSDVRSWLQADDPRWLEAVPAAARPGRSNA